ncbi:MAG: hydroxymethylglutaryl-CoA lyase [Phycisphaerae bacterium]|nr:hydroxymethylglutaryl-CoA lyase [Phycisphaerae bacterium]
MTNPTVRITEVGPRDGLQNEKATISTDAKVAYVDRLSRSGCAEVEVTSFVSPKWVPQLADAAEVLARIARVPGVVYSALVPNEKGLDAALAARVDKVSVFTAASETFCRRNVNASIAETIERFRPVVARAKAARLAVRGYVSCAVACPFEGPIQPRAVADVSRALSDLGCDEIDLGDTIGVAAPADIDRLLDAHEGVVAPDRITMHLHDTRGTGLLCAWRSYERGIRSFDASCGGIGGCPYAPGASGNVATEELVYAFERSGIATGARVSALLEAAAGIAEALGRALPSKLAKAGLPRPSIDGSCQGT